MPLPLLLACRAPDPPPPAVEPPSDPTGDTGGHAHTHDSATHDSATEPPTTPTFTGPWLLSEAGLYVDVANEVLVDGAIAFEPRYPLWSDGATKRRWLVVPAGETVDTTNPNQWQFPEGTLAFKEFSTADGVRLETRRLAKGPGGWEMVSYLWRPDGSDADAVPAGVVDALGTSHDVPDQEDCRFCHVTPNDGVLGVDAIQLDPDTQAALPLSAPVPAEVPGDDPTRAALGYLHGNCGNCHRDGALAGDRSGLWLDVAVGLTDPAASATVVSGLGKQAHHVLGGTSVVIVPGDPAASQLWYRMTVRGFEGMPPRGTEQIDDAGVAAVGAWITSLPAR